MNSRTTPPKTPVKKRLKGRPPQADVSQHRENFLGHALSVFLDKGYAGSSIEGIARQAKVSKNTIYLQFQTKENLFLQAVRSGLTKAHTGLDISFDETVPFETALLAIIERIQLLTADNNLRSLTRLQIAEAQRFPDIASELLADFRQMIAPISNYLKQATATYNLAIDNPTTAAFDLTMLALGGFNFLLAEPETSTTLLKERAIKLRNFLLKGWQSELPPRA